MRGNFKYDFSGYVTRNDLKCSDGRTIRRDAFKDDDGRQVPLVFQHVHNDVKNVLGHGILENREDGVYGYFSFNDTDNAKNAKKQVEHGDLKHLSIYANNLTQQGGNVLHGCIREVSLVLAGANPGAFIDCLCFGHANDYMEDSDDGEAIIYTEEELTLYHAEEPEKVEEIEPEKETEMHIEHAEEKTVQDVYDELTDEQKDVVAFLIGEAVKDATKDKNDEEDEDVKHNAFEDSYEEQETNVLSHSEMMEVFADAKRGGSLKDAVLAHGIEHIDYLFPEAKSLNNPPDWITRDMDWVKVVMSGVHHTPFSRIKSMFADLTEDEARAKGYIKGKMKKEEVFGLLKRTTTPTTIYKKQKLDRDDVIDITDFDVVAWLKGEMRLMLDEEIARAILVGDGRLNSSDDKINELNVRPIFNDEDLYTIKHTFDAQGMTASEIADMAIDEAVVSRVGYKGSGNPTFFTTEATLTQMLLLKDSIGHRIYKDVNELATAMRVSKIVTVPVMEGITSTAEGKKTTLIGLIVNLNDYNVGADKGGAVNMFDDFDIDYNAQKYLIETRCSGALTKPYSAIALSYQVNA